MTVPFVSVVVLNYNGLRFLDDCLGSLAQLDYPNDRYEVVLVDNVSQDNSAEIVKDRYPWVRIVRNSRNLGFAGGNNVAMRETSADYVVLLNNDTSVDRQWLAKLVEAADRDPKIGICTSKLLFKHRRVRIQMRTSPFRPREHGSLDERELGVQIYRAQTQQIDGSWPAEYLEGFYGVEPSPSGSFRWSKPQATFGLRVAHNGISTRLVLNVAAHRPTKGARFAIFYEDTILGEWEVGTEPEEVTVNLPQSLIDKALPVVQNAGTLILKDGSGRDRGTVVKGAEVYQEDDLGQYARQEEVFAGCGAALLLRRTMLEDVGLFDEDFFMYYEDMDLSWRSRRRGWKVMYIPEAVVHHVHAGSSVEWSPFFIYHVERSRLLMLGKNAPVGLAIQEHLRYLISTAMTLGRYSQATLWRAPDRQILGRRAWTQLRVIAFLTGQLPRTLVKRRNLAKRDVVAPSKLLEWMVPA